MPGVRQGERTMLKGRALHPLLDAPPPMHVPGGIDHTPPTGIPGCRRSVLRCTARCRKSRARGVPAVRHQPPDGNLPPGAPGQRPVPFASLRWRGRGRRTPLGGLVPGCRRRGGAVRARHSRGPAGDGVYGWRCPCVGSGAGCHEGCSSSPSSSSSSLNLRGGPLRCPDALGRLCLPGATGGALPPGRIRLVLRVPHQLDPDKRRAHGHKLQLAPAVRGGVVLAGGRRRRRRHATAAAGRSRKWYELARCQPDGA